MSHPTWRSEFVKGGNIFRNISKIIYNELGEEVLNIFKPSVNKNWVYRVETYSGTKVRFSFHKNNEIRVYGASKLQIIAYKNLINVPKIIVLNNRIKISEWIDGVELYFVQNLPEANFALGELIGKLNLVKHKKQYLTSGDINNTNFIWTKDKKLYLVDVDKLKLRSYEMAVKMVAHEAYKRINNERRKYFYKGYSKYHDIDILINFLNEYKKEFVEK